MKINFWSKTKILSSLREGKLLFWFQFLLSFLKYFYAKGPIRYLIIKKLSHNESARTVWFVRFPLFLNINYVSNFLSPLYVMGSYCAIICLIAWSLYLNNKVLQVGQINFQKLIINIMIDFYVTVQKAFYIMSYLKKKLM